MSKKFSALANDFLEEIEEHFGDQEIEMALLNDRKRLKFSFANCNNELSRIDRETISHIVKTRKVTDQNLRKFLH